MTLVDTIFFYIWLIYCFVGVAWAVHAGRKQIQLGYSNGLDLPCMFCLLINWALWPLAMLTAWWRR